MGRVEERTWLYGAKEIYHEPAVQAIGSVHKTYTDPIVQHARKRERNGKPAHKSGREKTFTVRVLTLHMVSLSCPQKNVPFDFPSFEVERRVNPERLPKGKTSQDGGLPPTANRRFNLRVGTNPQKTETMSIRRFPPRTT